MHPALRELLSFPDAATKRDKPMDDATQPDTRLIHRPRRSEVKVRVLSCAECRRMYPGHIRLCTDYRCREPFRLKSKSRRLAIEWIRDHSELVQAKMSSSDFQRLFEDHRQAAQYPATMLVLHQEYAAIVPEVDGDAIVSDVLRRAEPFLENCDYLGVSRLVVDAMVKHGLALNTDHLHHLETFLWRAVSQREGIDPDFTVLNIYRERQVEYDKLGTFEDRYHYVFILCFLLGNGLPHNLPSPHIDFENYYGEVAHEMNQELHRVKEAAQAALKRKEQRRAEAERADSLQAAVRDILSRTDIDNDMKLAAINALAGGTKNASAPRTKTLTPDDL